MNTSIVKKRKTRETDISVLLDMSIKQTPVIETGLPFFDHMLQSMAFHGGFRLEVRAKGDLDTDPHHLVEDTGLVMGQALLEARAAGIRRYGQALIPMDDALAEAVIDAGGRPYLVWSVDWPQDRAGAFDLGLLKEYFWGLATAGLFNLHLEIRYAENGHHAAEALFKAAGRALGMAYEPAADTEPMSTKGIL